MLNVDGFKLTSFQMSSIFQAALIISSIPKSKKDKNKKSRESRKEEEIEALETWFQSQIVSINEKLDFIDTLNV